MVDHSLAGRSSTRRSTGTVVATDEPSHIHIPRPSRVRRAEVVLGATDAPTAIYVGRRISCAPRPSSARP